MLLDDRARCNGGRHKMGFLIGICVACDRFSTSGPFIEPTLERIGGVFACADRRYSGHGLSVAPSTESTTPNTDTEASPVFGGCVGTVGANAREAA